MLVGGYTNSVCFFHAGSNHWLSGALPRVQGYNAIKIYQLCVWCTFLLFFLLPSRKKQKDINTDTSGFSQIATIFLGVHLLTSTTSPILMAKDEEGNQPPAEQPYEHVPIPYTTSSTSLHHFFSNASERTPLIRSITPAALPVPTGGISGIDGLPRRHSDVPLSRVPSSAPVVGLSTTTPSKGTRLTKRASASSFQSSIPKLGLGSQAGLLLIATTPPSTGYLATRGRGWSVGPTGRTGAGGLRAGEEEASLEDEGQGRRGRSKSIASLFPRSRTPSVARRGGRDNG